MASTMKEALDNANVKTDKKVNPNAGKGSKKPIYKGKVKWFDVIKGYGFITDAEGNEIYVHFSGIENGRTFIGFRPGDEVTFTTKADRQGRIQASAVSITPEEEVAEEKVEETAEPVEADVEEAADVVEEDSEEVDEESKEVGDINDVMQPSVETAETETVYSDPES